MTDRARDPFVGRTIGGRYELVERVGSGGMGAVYSARHVAMKRTVAVKILHPDLSGDATIAARFEREAQLASVLTSPHVVTLYDYGKESDGTLYLVMELLRGETLADRLRRTGALPCAEALEIARAIAAALATAHEKGVVHRDLKPENVMLTDSGAKVLDFGIARILESDGSSSPSDSKLTQAGQIVGTPMYMSPEAAARKPVGPAADLYALGCVLFEMIAGRPPFQERESVLVMGMHLRVPPELLSTTTTVPLPLGLDDLVDQLLAKAPADRPASASRVGEELARLASRAPEPTPPTRPAIATAPAQDAPPSPTVPRVEAPTVTPLSTAATVATRRSRASRVGVAVGAVSVLALASAVASFLPWRGGPEPTGRPVPRTDPSPVLAVGTAPLSAAAAGEVPRSESTDSGPVPAAVAPAEPPDAGVLAPDAGSEPAVATLRLVVSPASAAVTRITWDGSTVHDLTPCLAETCTWTHALGVVADGAGHRLVVSARGYRSLTIDDIIPRDDLLVPVALRRPRGGHATPSDPGRPGRRPPSVEDVFGTGGGG